MIYKMSKIMFKELCQAIEDDRKWKGGHAEEKDVISYVNDTFGLRGTVTQLSLVTI